MSAIITGQVWGLDLAQPDKYVLLAMADHADHQGNNVFPSVGLVAWKTGYSDRQVRRIIKSLTELKLLVVVKARQGRPTLYRIDIAAGKPLSPISTPDKMSDPVPSRDDKMSEGVGHDAVIPTPDIAVSDKPSDKPSPNRQKEISSLIPIITAMMFKSSKDDPMKLTSQQYARGGALAKTLIELDVIPTIEELEAIWDEWAMTHRKGFNLPRKPADFQSMIQVYRSKQAVVASPASKPTPDQSALIDDFLNTLGSK